VTNSSTKRFTLVAQRTNLTIDEGVVRRGFTYNGTSPGSLMLVNEGDNVEITVKNADTVTHGLSMHAANTQTSLKVANLPAGGTKKLSFKADVPGVYMYHCAPGGHGIMTHTMGGMFGMFVVEPKQKYTMEEELGRVPDIKVYLVQHETYANGRDFFDGQPLYVSFNGYNFRYVNQPIAARPGDYIRFYYVNVGPNLTATFHAVGGIWNYSYSQGNPANKLVGGQSILAGPSDSFVIDWQVPATGAFTMVSHALGTQAAKGAVGHQCQRRCPTASYCPQRRSQPGVAHPAQTCC
jgi:nitrite reductase (NO-forming)